MSGSTLREQRRSRPQGRKGLREWARTAIGVTVIGGLVVALVGGGILLTVEYQVFVNPDDAELDVGERRYQRRSARQDRSPGH